MSASISLHLYRHVCSKAHTDTGASTPCFRLFSPPFTLHTLGLSHRSMGHHKATLPVKVSNTGIFTSFVHYADDHEATMLVCRPCWRY